MRPLVSHVIFVNFTVFWCQNDGCRAKLNPSKPQGENKVRAIMATEEDTVKPNLGNVCTYIFS